MYLFIDTNVYLSFFHLTSDDLEELNKLSVMLKQNQITLLLPHQVVEEFERNREIKIADALKRLRDQRLNLQFPQLCKDYPEYAILRSLQRQYEEVHPNLIELIIQDVSEHNLKADKTISELFEQANDIKINEDIVRKAQFRIEIGNPPGKKGSLGDAINWEIILENTPDGTDLYFVTDDRDFISVLNENSLKEFLIEEWKKKKQSKIHYYSRLSLFFKEHFPDIKLASELEKEILIKSLASSGSFARTHSVIAGLSKCSDFTSSQRNEIVEAAISNNQIMLILGDSDVNEFMKNIIKAPQKEFDQNNLAILVEKLTQIESEGVFEGDEPF